MIREIARLCNFMQYVIFYLIAHQWYYTNYLIVLHRNIGRTAWHHITVGPTVWHVVTVSAKPHGGRTIRIDTRQENADKIYRSEKIVGIVPWHFIGSVGEKRAWINTFKDGNTQRLTRPIIENWVIGALNYKIPSFTMGSIPFIGSTWKYQI